MSGKPWPVVCTRHDGRKVEFRRYPSRAQALACVAKLIAHGLHAEIIAPEGEP
jgi:hypothetical protein